jgi:sensor histidine kinase YesM
VNPHFLFNALNTVARLAILENAPQTEQMAYALSRLLRYSLRKVDQLVPLEEEFQQVNTYLDIQKTRFQERLEFDLYLPDSLKNVLLPCMILQPLVENALVHGLEPKLMPGKIRLAARRSRGRLLIDVSDTGIGIPPEKLVLIQKQDDLRPISQRGSGLGLGIVRKRLQHYFGNQLDFKITSQVHQGTQVRIQIPL